MSGMNMANWQKAIQDEKLKKVQKVTAPKEQSKERSQKSTNENFKISRDDL